jgi:hypothetical protein
MKVFELLSALQKVPAGNDVRINPSCIVGTDENGRGFQSGDAYKIDTDQADDFVVITFTPDEQ